MSSVTTSVDSEPTAETGTDEDASTVGVVTRAVSWLLDWAVINLVAIITGLGVALLLSIFPLAKNLQTPFEAIAGGVYIVWCAAYFVAFWSLTGQTLGARTMQIRLVTAKRERVRPARAVVRWVAMNLSMLFFCAGYVPIVFGRRGFPDWLAKTLVLDTPQISFMEARMASHRAERDGARKRSLGLSPEPEAKSPVSADGRDEAVGLPESSGATRASG